MLGTATLYGWRGIKALRQIVRAGTAWRLLPKRFDRLRGLGPHGGQLPLKTRLVVREGEGEGVFKFVKWGQRPDTALLPLRRGSFPSYEGCDMYHSIEKPIDSLPLIFNTFMSFCLLHTKCKTSCLKQIIYHIPFCLPESHLLSS